MAQASYRAHSDLQQQPARLQQENREFSGILQVKDVTVRSWLAAGKMRVIRLGRVWRVTESDLKAFIEDRRPK